jgi:LPS-assembly lipoprotein
MNKTYFHSILITLFFSLLTACGFHLKGTVNVPPELHTIYFTSNSPYSSLTQTLQANLATQKIIVVQTAKQAPVTVSLLNEQQSIQGLGNSGDQQTRIYTFTDTVDLSLLKSDGTLIIGPITVSASQNFTLPAGMVPSNSPLTATVTQQTQQTLVQNILDRLSAQKVLNAIHDSQSPIKKVKPMPVTQGDTCTGNVTT